MPLIGSSEGVDNLKCIMASRLGTSYCTWEFSTHGKVANFFVKVKA